MPPTKTATKKKSPKPKALAEYFDAEQPDGVIRLAFGGVEYRLRRPLFGEHRKLAEEVREVSLDAARAQLDLLQSSSENGNGTAPIDGAPKTSRFEDAKARLRAIIDTEADRTADSDGRYMTWWEHVFEALEESGQKIPPLEERPMWLVADETIQRALRCWRSRPPLPGGN